jgi:hypothetical protein
MKNNRKMGTTWRSLLVGSCLALALVLATTGTALAQEKARPKEAQRN